MSEESYEFLPTHAYRVKRGQLLRIHTPGGTCVLKVEDVEISWTEGGIIEMKRVKIKATLLGGPEVVTSEIALETEPQKKYSVWCKQRR